MGLTKELTYSIITLSKEREENKMAVINNLPEYAKEYEWIVVTECDNEFWFWGAYHKASDAADVANQIDGIVVFNC